MRQRTRSRLRNAALFLSAAVMGSMIYADPSRVKDAELREAQLSRAPELKPEWRKQKLLEADRNLMVCGKLATTEIAKDICLSVAQLERADINAKHEHAADAFRSAHLTTSIRAWWTAGSMVALYGVIAAGILYLFRKKPGQDAGPISNGTGLPMAEGASV